ncbi:DUF2589 domain-containing protein [Polyangium aurulentum]|uniref:DUF2589 domain-containing protein n=1 Tax=Polyangium aurulentum TaxID=2567896 RepID=UPI001469CF3B|nr:DUF2589 domain-containing protein [Polyangium aurulentum]UQA54909.1 DUF2589 domain-containing protein [Polyangium aurulentum]
MKSEIALSKLIGALIRDVVDADGMAAQATADFIQSVGFDKGELRMVQFTYDHPDQSGVMKKYVVSVPLLTIVPIPLLGVQEAELSFTTTVVEMSSDEKSAPMLLAKVAPSAGGDDGKQDQANITFTVKMSRTDMPAGISNMMGLLGNKVQVAEAQTEKK